MSAEVFTNRWMNRHTKIYAIYPWLRNQVHFLPPPHILDVLLRVVNCRYRSEYVWIIFNSGRGYKGFIQFRNIHHSSTDIGNNCTYAQQVQSILKSGAPCLGRAPMNMKRAELLRTPGKRLLVGTVTIISRDWVSHTSLRICCNIAD